MNTTPLLSQPRVQRVLYPVLVAIALVAAWHGLVVGFELPPYLVPSPGLMMETLIKDWSTLFGSLLITMKITVFDASG